MKYAKRVDGNQADIVDALRQRYYSVLLLHRVGDGCPDLLVGTGGHNILLECKIAKGELRQRQVEFFETWRGPKAVIRSIDEALAFCSQFE